VTRGHTHDERQRHHSPDEPITAHQDAIQQVNKFNFAQTALSTVAIIFACLALGAIVMHAILYPQIVDAKIAAAVSKAEAEANEAKVTARVAMKEVATLCASLKAAKVSNADCH
jgi:hypothetical protein